MRTFTCPTCRRRVPQSGCGIVGGKRLCGNCAGDAQISRSSELVKVVDDRRAERAEARTIEGKLVIESAYGRGCTSVGVDSVTICDDTVTTTNGATYTRAQIEAGEIAVRYANGAPYLATYTIEQLFGWQAEAARAEQPAAEAAPVSKSNGRPAKVVYQVWDDTVDDAGDAAVKLFETANANDARTFTAVYARTLKATPGVTKVTGRAGKGHSYIDAAGKAHRVTIEACDVPVIGSEPMAPPVTYRARLAGIAAAVEALRKSEHGIVGHGDGASDYQTLVGKATEYASVVATAAARERGVSRMSSLNRIMNVVRAGKPHSVAALDLVELDRPLGGVS